MVNSTRRLILRLPLCFQSFSVVITSLREGGAGICAYHAFVCFALLVCVSAYSRISHEYSSLFIIVTFMFSL